MRSHTHYQPLKYRSMPTGHFL